MAILLVSFICMILGACAAAFLVPFLYDLADICVGEVSRRFCGNKRNDSVGVTSAKTEESVNFDIPARFSVDRELVKILVGNGFAEDEVVFFLERKQLPNNIIAGIKSGSDDKLGEFREMLHEYFTEIFRAKILGIHIF